MARSSRVHEEVARVEDPSASVAVETKEQVSEKAHSLRLLSVLWQARAELSVDEIETLATELESEIQAFPEDDINAIYGAVRALLADATTASSEVECARLLQRLRTLQQAEAEEMRRYFEEHSVLKEGSGLKALQTAKDLLSNYESVATSNTPRGQAARQTS